ITSLEDGSHTFVAADFGFSDPNDSPANAFAAVKITSLPGAEMGRALGGSATLYPARPPAAPCDLVFTPAANANGASYATFDFKVQDNGGTAIGGVDLAPPVNSITIHLTPLSFPTRRSSDLITILEDGSHTFVAADFGFSDPNDSPANAFAAVKITSLPGA